MPLPLPKSKAKAPSEAERARAAAAEAAAYLATLRGDEPTETTDDGREWDTGQPAIGSTPATEAYEGALQIEVQQSVAERDRILRAAIATAERKLEKKRDELARAGDHVRAAALRNLAAREDDLYALERERADLDDDRGFNPHTCNRGCGKEFPDASTLYAHRFDCRRARRDR